MLREFGARRSKGELVPECGVWSAKHEVFLRRAAASARWFFASKSELRFSHSLRLRVARVRRGFTLVECLISGTVLAGFGAAVAVAAGQAGNAARAGVERRAAAEALDTVLTRIDALGPARVGREGPRSGSEGDLAWAAAVTEEGALPDLYDVAVTVSWTDPAGRTRTVTGRTRLYDPAGSRSPGLNWGEL